MHAEPTLADARALLQHHFGHPDFRAPQQRVVEAVLAGHDVLGVLPTGAGKSACFQVPALLSHGLTLVVSPLISLMQDQVQAARGRGMPASALAGPMPATARHAVLASCRAGECRLLYAAPERLPSLVPALDGVPIARLVVDEAHCISEWGHDFRPPYRGLGAIRGRLGGPPALALTGSATPEVRQDILGVLRMGPSAHVVVTSFDRPNLRFEVMDAPETPADRLRLLVAALPPRQLAIVYAPTRRLTFALARALRHHGRRARGYHAGLPGPWRAEVLGQFLDGTLDTVVATCAFGMGIDAPHVRAVIHWLLPPTPESYYQEAGRAGRDGDASRCLLLHARGDDTVHRRQLDVTFPPRKLLERAWAGQVDMARLPAAVAASVERLRVELRPDRGPVDWARIEHRRALAERRLDAMVRYARSRGCRRQALLGWFGETVVRCRGCDNCAVR